MAVKKTQLYASLWASCDKLRGGMDSSEYKDYILTLLFMKYVTDKFKNKGAYEDIKVFDKAHDKDPDPEKRTGCSFDDFIALKGKKNIGEGMDKIIARLADENTDLKGVIDIAHFNDEKKLGSGKEMVDKLTDLISIFQRPELDFSRNKAEGDDIIGDAYEFLMRKFATESGKSKGQFYTPAEVSRILANVVGISHCTDASATVCDPACGSGSLLIRAIDAAPFPIMGYGQEKESTTAGLAKMNAVLHRKAEIIIKSGNTFSNPQYMDKSDNSVLERFDYIVANPPFSMKNWRDGIAGKEYGRFEGYGDMPPEKNGDYAWLMHILKTLKSNGKAAVILPHGVLFRGNAEATIRETIIKKHWIKGIISLPANLFYGTGIAACVLVIDKEGAANRQGIFMIDASRGYVKDGNKNRLRERDIYRIITTFNEQITTDPKYARFIPNDEIEKKNGYNLNITRYIDSTDPEDIQDIYAHIHGGIPAVDIDGLSKYWEVFPSLKSELLSTISEKYYSLNVEHESIRQTIYKNTEFSEYGEKLDEAFAAWKAKEYPVLSTLDEDVSARELIVSLAEDIIAEFEHLTLIDKYDAYQVLLAYWNEVMNDDVSLIISESDGYTNARATDNIEEEITQGKNKGEMKVTGWEGRLLPKSIVINAFFRKERNAIEEAESIVAETESQLSDLIESADEESALADVVENGKVKARDIEAKIVELTSTIETEETIELEVIRTDLQLVNTKKRMEAYLVGHPLCKSAVNENGKITKAYEPDMRKMIDNYITAADAEKIGDFDDLTLLDFVAKQGETLTGEGDSGHKEGAAEAIENNIRKKVIEKVTVNPRYYAKMSEILDKLIEERKQGVLDYAEMLEKYIKLAKDVDCPEDNDKYPESIRKSKALMAIYDNTGEDEKLALRIHKAVKKQALSGFRDNQVVVRRIKKALFEILGDDSEVERIYKIIEKQEEY